MKSEYEGRFDVVIESLRDERALAFLISTKGESAVQNAVKRLCGNRRPYVSNIAKILDVTIPDEVLITPRDEGRARLSEIKNILKSHNIKG
ncbi:hypothetical protein AB4Y42_22010 [Paraburkholderia sp. EG286B]|uniref:hypothetical protein n=1 Tax=Paraburkholderia sp. EG286B TaxID=3237011 RepID=UPI0034D2FC40